MAFLILLSVYDVDNSQMISIHIRGMIRLPTIIHRHIHVGVKQVNKNESLESFIMLRLWPSNGQ